LACKNKSESNPGILFIYISNPRILLGTSIIVFENQVELLENFYQTTLDALKEANNKRLWFKTNTKLGKLYFDREDWPRLQKILKQLHASCQVGTLL